ncbi:MAG: hypothetical protein NVV62_12325 [Terricaulis sp.]|nr:hypothetical protein [Terricaulis sp.]
MTNAETITTRLSRYSVAMKLGRLIHLSARLRRLRPAAAIAAAPLSAMASKQRVRCSAAPIAANKPVRADFKIAFSPIWRFPLDVAWPRRAYVKSGGDGTIDLRMHS